MSMFLHHKFIAAAHHVPLESAVRNHGPVTSTALAKLYKLAGDVLQGAQPDSQMEGVYYSKYVVGTTSVAVVTDIKSGVYLQLAKLLERPTPLLTVGQKWGAEVVNDAQGNVATVLW